MTRLLLTLALVASALAPPVSRAQEAAPAGALEPAPAADPTAPPADFTPPPDTTPALKLGGYVDLGFADAEGDGTSYAAQEERLPVDYAADPFAPAVNSRGDVASADPGGRFTNGFTPRSLGLGGRAGAFVSTASLDLRYAPEGSPLLGFVRVQFLPRLAANALDDTRVLLQQAFVRLIPLESQELALTLGRFDPVFGIEYLENEANLRTGITPSLVARYTTGWQLGAKAFYRVQLPSAWSALSLNAAMTTNSPLVDALQPSAISLSGRPMFSARAGYELNHPAVQLKLGLSAARGARTDQGDPGVLHVQQGADARVFAGPVFASAEWVRLDMREGGADKAGAGRLVSAFLVEGTTFTVAAGLPLGGEWLRRLTPYARYDRRRGGFTHFAHLDTDRRTLGARLDLGDAVVLKAEYLWNLEHEGAASVDNDVATSSLVFSF